MLIAPEGKTVIQVSLDQYEKDCKYWKKLYESGKDKYDLQKYNIARAIQNEIEKKFPAYEGKLRILDVWTPYSYLRRNNDTNGSFMRFITTALSVNAFLPQDIKGLGNVFLAGHYIKYPGGLPTAAQTGKDAIELIKATENRKENFKSTIKKIEDEITNVSNELVNMV